MRYRNISVVTENKDGKGKGDYGVNTSKLCDLVLMQRFRKRKQMCLTFLIHESFELLMQILLIFDIKNVVLFLLN